MKQIAVLIALSFVVGCGSPRSDRPVSNKKAPVTWPELEEFTSQDYTQSVSMPAESKQWTTLAKYAKSDEFKSSLEKFETASLPDQFVTDERSKAFETLISKYKELIAESEAGAKSKKIASIYSEIETQLSSVRKSES